ncbi:MAG TPA: tetratricopeptide repeat protein, partial [Candidatus Eisenbacteria bacterium]|nr:tetratricopeptide repeat protein [Candidatus Eisenbacteria bacterium]
AFQRAIERSQEFSGRAEAQKRLAFLNLDSSRTDAAVITSLQEQIRLQPDDLPALLRLAGVYERTGAPDKARQLYEDARKANPNNSPILIQLVRLYSTSLKNPQQALALAKEARKLAPDDAEVAYLLGRLADQSGDHRWASDLLQESAARQPSNPEVLFHLAQALYAIGRVNDAEDAMRRAVAELGTRNPELGTLKSEAQSFLSWVALSKAPEKQLEAEVQVQQVLKNRPDFLPAQLISGWIHQKRGRTSEARQVFEKILTDYPQFAPVRKPLAEIYLDSGDPQKALEYAMKAREAFPDDADVAKTLGRIADRRGENANAVRFFRESSLKRTEDPEVFYLLGKALSQQKAKADAKAESKTALERALALSPSASFAPDAKRILADLK